MTDDELMDLARPFASDGGRWPSDWLAAMRLAVAAERKACIELCAAVMDNGDPAGIERDVAAWNKPVKRCLSALKGDGT